MGRTAARIGDEFGVGPGVPQRPLRFHRPQRIEDAQPNAQPTGSAPAPVVLSIGRPIDHEPALMSLVLAFDCAVSGLAIAIVGDGTRLAGIAEEGRDQAARLLPAISAALDEAGVGRRELSLIAVTIGPGSFTGVRVGLAAARGLAVGLGVPLAGLATTRVLLAQARPRGRTVVAAIDSRLGDWFC